MYRPEKSLPKKSILFQNKPLEVLPEAQNDLKNAIAPSYRYILFLQATDNVDAVYTFR